MRVRQRELPAHLNEIGWKAQHRLHRRYAALQGKGKPHNKVVTSIGRELLGFVWAIAVRVERDHTEQQERSHRRAA